MPWPTCCDTRKKSYQSLLAVLALLEEDASVDPLLDHHEAQAGRVVVADVLEAVLELQHLVLRSHIELTVSHTITENDDCVGPTVKEDVKNSF